MRCAIFEENGNLHNVQRAIVHATVQNVVRRHGDFILTTCAANALQPYLQNDNGWIRDKFFHSGTGLGYADFLCTADVFGPSPSAAIVE